MCFKKGTASRCRPHNGCELTKVFTQARKFQDRVYIIWFQQDIFGFRVTFIPRCFDTFIYRVFIIRNTLLKNSHVSLLENTSK